jgi:alpha-D-xyloside xylohydrolase
MSETFEVDENAGTLLCRFESEIVRIEPWGRDSLRVRASRSGSIRDDTVGALLVPVNEPGNATVTVAPDAATLRNGQMELRATRSGTLSFRNVATGTELLREKAIHSLTIPARSYADLPGGAFKVEVCFEAIEGEHLYGLGQHQHGRLDQKGCVIDLVQRNTEVSIPFLLSSQGYGFLWNNPALGRVELGLNATRWVAEATPQVDYWITTGQSPAAILRNYADATGHPRMLPAWAAGYWQSKLRYASQAELESVVREYQSRGLPLSVIVIDFFHWTRHGEWRFDPEKWPDPAGMVAQLRQGGIRVMVSVWPTVSRLATTWAEMWQNGYIVRNMRGAAGQMYFVDNGSADGIYLHFYDSTHPGARDFIWGQVREGYYRHGIDVFWLDACEPEMLPLAPDNLRFHAGPGLEVANIYPLDHARAFFDGMCSVGEEEIFLLCRSAWAGSQRYGAAVWSGDIESTFASLRNQVTAGLNMAASGIPWWTHDIGGFRGGDPASAEFRELLVRWFQFGAFSPIFRMHGHRLPDGDDFSGGPNELWSFGDEAYVILRSYLELRERLRPYVMTLMRTAHEDGIPPMRPLFLEFPDDGACHAIETEYMFGPDLLVAPILEAGARSRAVYLPEGPSWTDVWTGAPHDGGRTIEVDAPLERIPLFLRDSASLPIVDG